MERTKTRYRTTSRVFKQCGIRLKQMITEHLTQVHMAFARPVPVPVRLGRRVHEYCRSAAPPYNDRASR